MYRKLFVLSLVKFINTVIIKNCNVSLSSVIRQFEDNPTDVKYLEPLRLAKDVFPYPYRILIFSPKLQSLSNIECPEHSTPLVPSRWTDILDKTSSYNPRLIHCIFHNILLIQQYYKCELCDQRREYLSCSKSILRQTNQNFPYRVFRRSIISEKLINFMFEQLAHGVNFNGIAQSIANFHFQDYQASISNLNEWTLEHFYADKLSCYPTKETLITIFLDIFQERRHLLDSAVVSRIPQGSISADHTFRISKNIGTFRDVDEKFVNEGMKLFIVMDSFHYIVGWKLTKTSQFLEIEDILQSLKRRLDTDTPLRYVIVDNCCELARLYGNVFANVDVKLDIFHAVQRLTSILPHKKSAATRQVSDAVGLIFRKYNDKGSKRTLQTPSPPEILTNLEMFLVTHDSYFSSLEQSVRGEFFKAVDRLKIHIQKGCLSDIAPGDGTECNERLHRLLNQSCFKGMSVIGPELALALLTLLFYYYNSKVNGRSHDFNRSIIPVPPLSFINNFSNTDVTETCIPSRVSNALEHENPLVNLAVKKMQETLSVLNNVKKSILRRNFSIESLLSSRFLSESLSIGGAEEILNSEANGRELYHHNMLVSNCQSFGLNMFEIPRDGDCLFRSILRQVKMHVEFNLSQVQTHFRNVGLAFQSEEDDILVLRRRFVEDVSTKNYLHPYMYEGQESEIEEFLKPGVFSTDLGDLVVCALSNILNMPIIVICSHSDMSAESFLPNTLLFSSPIFVAYNNFESHYYSTIQVNTDKVTPVVERSCSDSNGDVTISCKCRGTEASKSCLAQSTRCRCRIAKRDCGPTCQCRFCGNNKAILPPKNGCKCQIGKEPYVKSCADNSSLRRTRCLCFKASVACTDLCKCVNCGNMYGQKIASETSAKVCRKEDVPTKYKRKRGSKYLEDLNMVPAQGSWTSVEVLTLNICIEVLFGSLSNKREPSIVEIQNIFNAVVLCCKGNGLRTKTFNQIRGKLNSRL